MTEAVSCERSSVLADTHVLVWYTTAPGMLSTTALRVLEDAETLRELLASIQASDSPIAIAPMTVDVAHQMVSVSRTQVRDPFDRTIVATAQAMELPLLTKDSTLTRHFPKLCVW